MTDALSYWLNRLAVMQRATCVEVTASEAGELRGLLLALKADQLGAYGPVTPAPPPVDSLPTYTVGRTSAVMHVFPGDGSVHEVKQETEAERAGRLMVEAAQNR